jgi:hypothetical protein
MHRNNINTFFMKIYTKKELKIGQKSKNRLGGGGQRWG